MNPARQSELFVLALPILVWLAMNLFFNLSARRFGKDVGYLLSFAVYWLVF